MNYANQSNAANAYRQNGLRHEIESASPHRLIQLMMERVLSNIAVAKGFMQRGAISEKGEQISAALNVISGLQASLNHKPNASLSGNFDALYDYMSRRLLESNFNNDIDGLNEVSDLMHEIKLAWDIVGDKQNSPASASETK